MKVILLGSAGVGKGTNAKKLAVHYSIPTISSGDLLRAEVVQASDIGKKAKNYMDKGDLVPNELIDAMIKKRLKELDCKNGFILDGYPRNLEQAKLLDKTTKINAVINYTASTKLILERLGGRRHCLGCDKQYNINTIKKPTEEGICDECGEKIVQRDDDKPSAIKKRLDVYKKEVTPVIAYYKKQGTLTEIDASYSYHELHKIIDPTVKAIDSAK
jgi:adenylate kinase